MSYQRERKQCSGEYPRCEDMKEGRKTTVKIFEKFDPRVKLTKGKGYTVGKKMSHKVEMGSG